MARLRNLSLATSSITREMSRNTVYAFPSQIRAAFAH
jgi:hypothetical protein